MGQSGDMLYADAADETPLNLHGNAKLGSRRQIIDAFQHAGRRRYSYRHCAYV